MSRHRGSEARLTQAPLIPADNQVRQARGTMNPIDVCCSMMIMRKLLLWLHNLWLYNYPLMHLGVFEDRRSCCLCGERWGEGWKGGVGWAFFFWWGVRQSNISGPGEICWQKLTGHNRCHFSEFAIAGTRYFFPTPIRLTYILSWFCGQRTKDREEAWAR